MLQPASLNVVFLRRSSEKKAKERARCTAGVTHEVNLSRGVSHATQASSR